MGKLIAFWSPYEGKSKVTSSLCAIAGIFGMEYPEISVAISHGLQAGTDLEEKLFSMETWEEQCELYKKTGIAALKIHCRQGILSAEKIRRSGVPLCMKSLYLYPYIEQAGDRGELTTQLVTETIKSEFDIVLLDLKSGVHQENECFFEAADLVVVVLPQEPVYLKRFLKNYGQNPAVKEYCFLFGGYLEKSKYRYKFYQKNKEFWKNFAGVIPNNVGFLDAMAEGKTLDYFMKNRRLNKKEENYEFIVQTKKAAEYIRKQIFIF